MAAIPGAGLLGENVDRSQVKVVPIQDGRAVFSNNITLPVEPMIGVIGVAPSKEAVPCGTPGSHGGNMDNARIGAGATLYLPVFAEGALLAMGDLHACMGDGEIMVTGVEAAGSVDVKVEVIRGMKIDNPILEDKNCIYTIASDTDLMKAVKTATAEMHNIVMRKLGLSYNEAGMLMSAVGNVQICQVVDPSLTVRFAMPKTIIANIF
jgi:amidase